MNNDWKIFFAIALILSGVVIGVYVGFWLCFVGGIIQVIEAIKADVVVSMDVALGCGRVVFSVACGWISALIFIIPGVVILEIHY